MEVQRVIHFTIISNDKVYNLQMNSHKKVCANFQKSAIWDVTKDTGAFQISSKSQSQMCHYSP